MGVDVTHYVMLAAKLSENDLGNTDDEIENKIEKYEDNAYSISVGVTNNLTMVSDGMDGKYIFIGRESGLTGFPISKNEFECFGIDVIGRTTKEGNHLRGVKEMVVNDKTKFIIYNPFVDNI